MVQKYTFWENDKGLFYLAAYFLKMLMIIQ